MSIKFLSEIKSEVRNRMSLRKDVEGIQQKISQNIKFLFVFCLSIILIPELSGQTFNANFRTVSFLAANKSHRVGTNGSAVGDVTLYTNAITIGGQQIDCIVRTLALTNGSFTLPASPAAGTIAFDYSSSSGTSFSSNEDSFFSPLFNFNAGGGSCRLRFELILGGSFNNTTRTGTTVTLQNVVLNTYDIDGNGGAGSNQFNQFGGFSKSILSTGSNISTTYDANTGLTRFRSNSDANTTAVTADANRIKIEYSNLSSFEIIVGAEGSGAAYFFLDFSTGPNWSGATVTSQLPVLDLNTGTTGIHNAVSTSGESVFLSTGNTNYTQSSNSIQRVQISVNSAEILNGNNEFLQVSGSGSQIALGFTTGTTQTLTLAGVTYSVQTSVSGGVRIISFSRNGGGTLTTTQAETLVDALKYQNTAATPTEGVREFDVTVIEGAFASPTASSFITVTIVPLPVQWLYFTAKQLESGTVLLKWGAVEDVDANQYQIQYRKGFNDWKTIKAIGSKSNVSVTRHYQFTVENLDLGDCCFRVLHSGKDLQTHSSIVRCLKVKDDFDGLFKLVDNPVKNNKLRFYTEQATELWLCNASGVVVFHGSFSFGNNELITSGFPAGLYFLRTESGIVEQVVIQ